HGDTELVAFVADEHPDPADLVADESLADDLARVLTRLEEREQRILTMRFGLGTADGPCTLHEAGAAFGITRERHARGRRRPGCAAWRDPLRARRPGPGAPPARSCSQIEA